MKMNRPPNQSIPKSPMMKLTKDGTKLKLPINQGQSKPKLQSSGKKNKPKKKKRKKLGQKKTVYMPANVGFTRNLRDTPVTVQGRDRLTAITVLPTLAVADMVIFADIVDTTMVPGARLAILKTLFTEYRFSRLKLVFEPSAPTSLAAQILMLYDYDPDYNPTADVNSVDSVLGAVFAHSNSITGSVSTPMSQNCKFDGSWYFCEREVAPVPSTAESVKFSSAGSIFVVQTTPLIANPPITTPIAVGTLFVEWAVEMRGARSPAFTGAGTVPSPADPYSWASYEQLAVIVQPTGLTAAMIGIGEDLAPNYATNLYSNSAPYNLITIKQYTQASTVGGCRTLLQDIAVKIPTSFASALDANRVVVPLTGTPVSALIGTLWFVPYNTFGIYNNTTVPPTTGIGGPFPVAYGVGMSFTSTSVSFGRIAQTTAFVWPIGGASSIPLANVATASTIHLLILDLLFPKYQSNAVTVASKTDKSLVDVLKRLEMLETRAIFPLSDDE